MPVATLHVSLAERSHDDVELRYWLDDPRRHLQRVLNRAEISDLAHRSEDVYYAVTTPDLEAVGRRLYRWLDGTDRWLARELGALSATAVALAIDCRGRLAHLPWEALHDGTTFLVRGANPAVLPVRWRPKGPAAAGPVNRALSVLFMATSPLGVQPELNYEEEEGRILAATQTYPLALRVEETGTLKELGDLVRGYPEGYFDVLHLTGHADHRPDGPRFLTESATGAPEWVSAADVAREVPRRPRLTFLSGCRTAQSLAAGAVPSLAEELLGLGFPAVLGWGRPVLDAAATAAAAALYDRLAAGFSPADAVLHAHAVLDRPQAKHWHLLRLFVAGAMPAPLVTAPRTPHRQPAPPPTNQKRFLWKKDNTKGTVVDRKDFVGRRRPLQRFLRALRGGDKPAGVVVHGLGGVGKSSLANRLLDRLEEFEPAVHVGALDEPGLLRTLEQLDTSPEERAELQGTAEPLRHRLRAFLRVRQGAGRKKLLLVLDDFEQNTPLEGGQPLISPQAQDVVEALVWAVEQTDAARCLITSRYKLTTSQAALFYQEELSALRQAEVEKKSRALSAYRAASPELRARADRVADGNPRLMERLDQVLGQRGLDHAAILARVEATAAEFREQILLGQLLSGLPGATRQCLAGLLVYELPVPFEAVAALFPDRPAGELRSALDAAAALGLVEQEPDGPADVYRVPRLLEPLLRPDLPADPPALVAAAAGALERLWWGGSAVAEPQALELLRLAREARSADIGVPVADEIGDRWLNEHRYGEARSLYEEAMAAVGPDYRLLGGLGRAALVLGDGPQAHRLLTEAVELCPPDDVRGRSFLLHHLAELLAARGELDEALRIRREEELPVYERLGDVRSRAVTLGQVADILAARGELDEALRIRREEELPVYERLGDVRSRAVTLGRVADILYRRGELDEALRIRREEELPVYDRLGDVRSRAAALGGVADILADRGELDEALRILREEELPVYDRLGDVRARAVALGRVADILYARGELDEALRIRREQLPVYERLGDVRRRAVTLGKVADILYRRGEVDEALRIRREEVLPVYERLGDVRERAAALGRVADILADRGQPDEALRILREEVLPVFDRLGDVRERAAALGRVADILHRRGEPDEALRILREEVLPVFDRLGDVRARAVALGRVADILADRGQPDEALRILREEELPVYDRLGDVRSRAVALGQVADILYARGELDEALRIRREEELPAYDRLGDVRERAAALGGVADILHRRGQPDEALRILREEQLPACDRLGDVRARAVALGRVADILADRGQPDEALRIRREEELPVYDRLGDVRSRAVALGKVADILYARGELDEALRILREEVLPPIRRLQDQVSLTQVLLRLGVSSARLRQTEEAVQYLREAQEGASRLQDLNTLRVIQQYLEAIEVPS